MPPVTASAPVEEVAGRWPTPHGEQLLSGYLTALVARGAGNRSYTGAAARFLSRWPDPQAWAQQPLQVRLSAGSSVRPLLNYLMLAGHLRPGYDYLLERKLAAILREAQASPMADEVRRFLSAATELGYTGRVAAGLASQIAVRLMIQTGRSLGELDDTDFAELDCALTARERAQARPLKHYRTAFNATRTVLHHMDGKVDAAVRSSAHLRWPWRRHFAGVPAAMADSLVAYLECASGTSPGSSPPVTPRWTAWPDWTGNVTSSPTWPHWPSPETRALARRAVCFRAALAGADRGPAHRRHQRMGLG